MIGWINTKRSHDFMHTKHYHTFFILAVFVAAFVFASHTARQYEPIIKMVIQSAGVWAPIGFVVLTAVFVVFVIPLDIVFLIPVGVSVWGAIPVALMSITGLGNWCGICFLHSSSLRQYYS